MPCQCCSSTPTYSTCPDLCAYGVRADVENLNGSFTAVDSSDYKCCENIVPAAFQWTYNGVPYYNTHFGRCSSNPHPPGGECCQRFFWEGSTDKPIAANSATTIHGIPKTFTSPNGYTFNRSIYHSVYAGCASFYGLDYRECQGNAPRYVFGTREPLYGGVDVGYCNREDFLFSNDMTACGRNESFNSLVFEERQLAVNVIGTTPYVANETCNGQGYFAYCGNSSTKLRVREVTRWANFELQCVSSASIVNDREYLPPLCEPCARDIRPRWLIFATLYFSVKEYLACDLNLGIPFDGCPIKHCAKKYRMCYKPYLVQGCANEDRIKPIGYATHRCCNTVGAGADAPTYFSLGCNFYPTWHLIGNGASSDMYLDVEIDTGGVRIFADNATNATTAFSWDQIEYDQMGYDLEGDCIETEFWDDKTWKCRIKRSGECCCQCLETADGLVCAGTIGSRCSSGGYCEAGGVCVDGECVSEFP